MAKLSARVKVLERVAAAAGAGSCSCGGPWEVVHAREPDPGERARGMLFIEPGSPAPPPRACPSCGLPRNQVVIRYVQRPVPRW